MKNFGQNDNEEYEGGRAPVWEPADAARDMNEGNMSEVAEINKGDDKVGGRPCWDQWAGVGGSSTARPCVCCMAFECKVLPGIAVKAREHKWN